MAESGLKLSESMRVALALNGGLSLDLNREESAALIKILEREEALQEAHQAFEAAKAEYRFASERLNKAGDWLFWVVIIWGTAISAIYPIFA